MFLNAEVEYEIPGTLVLNVLRHDTNHLAVKHEPYSQNLFTDIFPDPLEWRRFNLRYALIRVQLTGTMFVIGVGIRVLTGVD